MLTLDLHRIFRNKGIENGNVFLKKCGLAPQTASRLLNNDTNSISCKHLERICLALHCTIDDLFSWKDTSDGAIHKEHVMQKLKRDKNEVSMAAKLKHLLIHRPDDLQTVFDNLSKSKKQPGL